MTVKLTTTAKTGEYCKCLVYGESDAGKTWLCKTAPKPVIISAENGLMTLRDVNIPVIEISTFADLERAYQIVKTDKRLAHIQTVCLDSISDIAEAVLAEEKANPSFGDPRQAYGAYLDKLLPLLKKFRDLPGKHIYFTAKIRQMTDEFTGKTTFGPSMPGKQLGPQLPYLFDFVFALRKAQTATGKKFRYLQTEGDIQYVAKNRGGRLAFAEKPDLAAIFNRALAIEPPSHVEKNTDLTETVSESEANTRESRAARTGESTNVSDISGADKSSDTPTEKAVEEDQDGSFSTSLGQDDPEDEAEKEEAEKAGENASDALQDEAENFLMQNN